MPAKGLSLSEPTSGEEWIAGLPAVVETGAVPDQAALDSWARRHTFGLIERFPIRWHPAIYLILATALATRVSWECPFELAPASSLGPDTPWAKRLTRVLRAPQHHGHRQFIAATPQAGDVAIHTASARGGLLVASVAAAAEVPAADVLAAAHALAVACAVGTDVERRSLFDLPLGDGPAWSLREEMSDSGGGQEFTAVLPAWSANSRHDLADPRLGFGAAASALAGPDPWEANQAAMARYTRIGFEAAAVTAMAVALSMRRPSRGLRRPPVLVAVGRSPLLLELPQADLADGGDDLRRHEAAAHHLAADGLAGHQPEARDERARLATRDRDELRDRLDGAVQAPPGDGQAGTREPCRRGRGG